MIFAAITPLDGLLLLGVGLLAGCVGGMLGVGGGILMIPAMVIFLGDLRFGPNSFHVYKLAAITTSLVLTAVAVVRHARARAIVYAALPGILPLAAVGVILGVILANTFIGEHTVTLRRIFGGFLELTVLINLYQEWNAMKGETYLRTSCPMPKRRAIWGPIVGLPSGITAGLLGIGGGVWAVPAQRMLLGVRIRSAIANSAFMIICVSVVASVSLSVQIARFPEQQSSPWQGYCLAFCLAPGALLGGWIGGGLTHRVPVRMLRYAFQLLLAVTGLRLMLG